MRHSSVVWPLRSALGSQELGYKTWSQAVLLICETISILFSFMNSVEDNHKKRGGKDQGLDLVLQYGICS